MGKMLSSSAANIDIGSNSDFPEYADMPALTLNVTSSSTSKAKNAAGSPSYSTVVFLH